MAVTFLEVVAQLARLEVPPTLFRPSDHALDAVRSTTEARWVEIREPFIRALVNKV